MFKLHPSNRITITAGDSAEIDMRLFNKDSLPVFKPKHRPLNIPALLPLRDIDGNIITDHIPCIQYDSEGNVIVDSEGNPILNSEGLPVYPDVFDSEGRPLLPYYWVFGKGPQFDWQRFPKLPSGYHQLQEEFINGELRLVVKDIWGKVVLDKTNDEFRNTIFLDREDTINIDPGLYLYDLIYTTDKDTDMEEVQTVVQQSFFEVW